MSTIPYSITDANAQPLATDVATALAPSSKPASSAVSTVTATPSAAHSPTLTPGEIAGITIAGVATAVVVFFILGAILSCMRKRRLAQNGGQQDQADGARFGGSEKGPSTDVEQVQESDDGSAPSTLPYDVAKAYPRIADPSNIGVAVSDPRQMERTPVETPASAESANSRTRLVANTSPPQHHTSASVESAIAAARPSQDSRNRSVSNSSYHTQASRHKPTNSVTPPSAYSSTFLRPESSIAPSLPSVSSQKPLPLAISKPSPAANPLHSNPRNPPGGRNRHVSNNSVNTVISEEPMANDRQSVPKIIPRAPLSTSPPQPTASSHGTDTRDYFYNSQPAVQTSNPPALHLNTAVPTQQSRQQTSDNHEVSPLSPPTRTFSQLLTDRFSLGKSKPTTTANNFSQPSYAASQSHSNTRPQQHQHPSYRRTNSKGRARTQSSSESLTSSVSSLDEYDFTTSEAPQLSPISELQHHSRVIPSVKQPSSSHPALRHQTSQSSLLEKRKGSDGANEMQRNLWITGSNGRTDDSAPGYGVAMQRYLQPARGEVVESPEVAQGGWGR
ncbi:MAG: hypothetical protein Q9159_004201 [Coniocarpon cinnabarinum]